MNHPEQIAVGEDHVFWSDGRSRWSFFDPNDVAEARDVRNGASRGPRR